MTDPYHAASLADLASWMVGGDEQHRWRLVAEFLEEYRHEPPIARLALLECEPPKTGDEHWDVFLGALAEHLAAREDRATAPWAQQRTLRTFWFPFNTRAARADALVNSPAAFRRRGVFIAPEELGVA